MRKPYEYHIFKVSLSSCIFLYHSCVVKGLQSIQLIPEICITRITWIRTGFLYLTLFALCILYCFDINIRGFSTVSMNSISRRQTVHIKSCLGRPIAWNTTKGYNNHVRRQRPFTFLSWTSFGVFWAVTKSKSKTVNLCSFGNSNPFYFVLLNELIKYPKIQVNDLAAALCLIKSFTCLCIRFACVCFIWLMSERAPRNSIVTVA